ARPLVSAGDTSVGRASPGRTIHAMVWPTGTSAPSRTLTPARMPSPGASISITALSVSTSSRVSPLATLSPSFFRQAISLPVSCAISRAGITTLIGINRDINRDRFQLEGLLGNTDLFRFRAGFNHVNDALAGGSFRLASGRQRTVHREIVGARHQALLRLGPNGSDFGRRAARPNELNRRVEILTASLVGVHHRMRCVSNRETPVVAGTVSHVGMQDVVIDGITRAQHTIGKDMWVRVA